MPTFRLIYLGLYGVMHRLTEVHSFYLQSVCKKLRNEHVNAGRHMCSDGNQRINKRWGDIKSAT